MVNSGVVAAIL